MKKENIYQVGKNRTVPFFLVSFVGHCLLLGMPGKSLDSARIVKPDEVAIQIVTEMPPLLPDIDVMGEEKKLKDVIEEEKYTEPTREVVSERDEVVLEQDARDVEEVAEVVHPSEEAMLRYQDMVKHRIEKTRNYPVSAKRQCIEGTVSLRFSILRSGSGENIRVVRSSGSTVLDKEAVDTIRRASPFPPFPEKIAGSSIQMELSIVFSLR